MNLLTRIVLFLAAVSCLFAQQTTGNATLDHAIVQVGRINQSIEGMPLAHPYHIEARHPKPGCDHTEICGELFYVYDGHNIRVSAGTTWQSQLMGRNSAPTDNAQAQYLGLTNTAITPAMADTTLSGLITSNGLSCAQDTYTDNSGVITVPAAPTTTVVGGSGTAVFYFVIACGQGICGTPSAASASTSVAATLNTTNYVQVSWTASAGATSYVVIRSNSSSAPSGSLAGGATLASTGQLSAETNAACPAGAGTCQIDDESNTVNAYTVPGSNLTNYGTFTAVHTWTATAAQSAQAFGLFTNSACTSNLRFEGTFTQVSLNTNDTFQLTETVNFAMFSLEYLLVSMIFGIGWLCYTKVHDRYKRRSLREMRP